MENGRKAAKKGEKSGGMMKAIVGLMLSVCAWEDFRAKRITVWYPVCCAGAGILIGIIDQTWRTSDYWFGILLGAVLLAAAEISRNRFGVGDGVILSACGICLGGKALVFILMTGMLLFLMVGIGGIIARKWNGNKELCFVPFIWAGFVIDWIIGGI